MLFLCSYSSKNKTPCFKRMWYNDTEKNSRGLCDPVLHSRVHRREERDVTWVTWERPRAFPQARGESKQNSQNLLGRPEPRSAGQRAVEWLGRWGCVGQETRISFREPLCAQAVILAPKSRWARWARRYPTVSSGRIDGDDPGLIAHPSQHSPQGENRENAEASEQTQICYQ